MTAALLLIALAALALICITWTVWDVGSDLRRRRSK